MNEKELIKNIFLTNFNKFIKNQIKYLNSYFIINLKNGQTIKISLEEINEEKPDIAEEMIDWIKGQKHSRNYIFTHVFARRNTYKIVKTWLRNINDFMFFIDNIFININKVEIFYETIYFSSGKRYELVIN